MEHRRPQVLQPAMIVGGPITGALAISPLLGGLALHHGLSPMGPELFSEGDAVGSGDLDETDMAVNDGMARSRAGGIMA